MEIWGGNRAVNEGVDVAGIDAWVVSRPYRGDAAGGDIHFVSTCGHGQIIRFMVADVAGHGEEVSRIAVQLRRLMRKYIDRLDQTRFVRDLNREFASLANAETFATALLSSYYAPTEHLIVCNAGHPRPLWYRARTGTWQQLVHTIPERLERVSNLPLGIVAPTAYHQFAVQLELDDLVLIYTDGLVEARDTDGKLLGDEGLLERVRQTEAAPPEAFARALLEAVAGYRGHEPAQDDVTLVLLHRNASRPPRQSLGQMVKVMGKMLGLIKV